MAAVDAHEQFMSLKLVMVDAIAANPRQLVILLQLAAGTTVHATCRWPTLAGAPLKA